MNWLVLLRSRMLSF